MFPTCIFSRLVYLLYPDPHLSMQIRIKEAYLNADPDPKHCGFLPVVALHIYHRTQHYSFLVLRVT